MNLYYIYIRLRFQNGIKIAVFVVKLPIKGSYVSAHEVQ